MPEGYLLKPKNLRDPYPLVNDRDDKILMEEARSEARREYKKELLSTTKMRLPDPPQDHPSTVVFESDEDFNRAAREASTLGDPAPLGPFTPYKPGFKADILLKDASDVKRHYREAIASIESAGADDYAAIGPRHRGLGRALGRYQVMEVNIGPWSKAALGREVTVKEFLENERIQDAVFDHRFNRYVKLFGSPEKAAQAWFAGPRGVGKLGRRDVLGTSVGEYGKKFTEALNKSKGRE